MTTRLGRASKRTIGNPVARLEKAEQSAQAQQEARDEAASQERQKLIASWNVSGRVPEHLATASDEVKDEQIVIMAQELMYQYERKRGPVRPLLPTPDLTTEEWAALTDAEVAGYCKGVLTDDVLAGWTRPRKWLIPEGQENNRQSPGERQ